MKTENYLINLEERLSKYFDIDKNFGYKDFLFDLHAKSFVRNERYIASKKATIYAYENNEYCFVKNYEMIRKDELLGMIELLKNAVSDFVVPHEEHMSSVITGVMIVENELLDQEIQSLVKKFKFHKSFAFGFKGWVDVRLILISLSNREVITNKKGREVQRFYQIC